MKGNLQFSSAIVPVIEVVEAVIFIFFLPLEYIMWVVLYSDASFEFAVIVFAGVPFVWAYEETVQFFSRMDFWGELICWD